MVERPFRLPQRETPLSELQTNVDQVPPHSIEAEDGFLSGLVCDPENRIDDAAMNVPVEAFYTETRQMVYSILIEMWKKTVPIDIATVTHRCRERQIIDKIGGAGWISTLFSFRPVSAHWEFYQRVIMEKFLLREQIRASLVAIHKCFQYGRGTDDTDINDVLDDCEQMTRTVRDKSHAGKIQTIKELCLSAQDSFLTQVEEARTLVLDEHGNPPIPGLSTGIGAIDEMTLGLCEGHPWFVLAGTSDGKTAFAQQVSLFNSIESSDPVPVCYYLTESSSNDWIKRGWSYLSRVPLDRIMRGTALPHEAELVMRASASMAGSEKLHLRHVPGITDNALEADMRYMHRVYGIRIFAIDYIQRIRLTTRRYGQNDADALSEFSQRITDQTARMKATTLVLSQLTEDGKIAKARAMAWDAEIAVTISKPLLAGQKDTISGGRVFRGERDEKRRDFTFHKARMTGARGSKVTLNFDGERQRFR